MWRALIRGIARIPTLAGRADAINQCAAKLFQLHYFGLLPSYGVVKFVQQLVLVGEP